MIKVKNPLKDDKIILDILQSNAMTIKIHVYMWHLWTTWDDVGVFEGDAVVGVSISTLDGEEDNTNVDFWNVFV